MLRIKNLFKFYKRYEVDLWGKIGFKHNNRISTFLKKIENEKRNNIFYLKRKIKKKFINFDDINYQKNFKHVFYLKNRKKKNVLIKSVPFKKKFIKFVYRIDQNEPKRKRKKTTLARDLFIMNRKLRSFYGNIKRLQLRRYARNKIYKLQFKLIRGFNLNKVLNYKNKNIFNKVLAINSFLSLIEHRLDIILYRSNFVSTIYQARHLIKYKKIFINNILATFCNFQVKNFDIISLSINIELNFFKYLKFKLKNKKILNYPPSYIYVNYNLMKSCIIKNPNYNIIPFPFSIDLKKWLGLAKMNI
jgi:ribosomal protein S4